MCSGWSYSPPCVAIKKSDLEPKSLGSLSASLSFSFCFFSVSVAQSGPPEKHMPVQQRGETKFLLLLLSWPEQTPHQVGKSASRLCQAKILVRPPLPPATPKIPQSCQIHSAAQFRLDSFFFFCSCMNLYMWNPRKRHHNPSTSRISAAVHICLDLKKSGRWRILHQKTWHICCSST